LGGGGFSGFSNFEDIFGNFGDIFGDFFDVESIFGGGGRSRGSRQRRGADLQIKVSLTLEEAAKGKEAIVDVPRRETCEDCKGEGTAKGSKKETCQQCRGTGQMRVSQGFFSIARTCSICHGSGSMIKNPCRTCNGTGLIQKKRKINVKLPPGVDTGSRLKIQGEGEASAGGGLRGNLYVYIEIAEHKHYTRDGDHIICAQHIAFTQAALGAHIEVPTIDGKVKLKIPAGTQSGKVFRLAGKGMPNLHGYGRGDEYVRVTVAVPTKLTEEQKELLRQYAALGGEAIEQEKSKSFFDKVKKGFQP